jgi:hypothetical protein
MGVQENLPANEATADVQFNNFLYKANNMGVPISKTTEPPREPEPNSPSFYQEMATWPSRQVFAVSYSGRGTAALKRYNDGRWVLTGVQFNFKELNANVTISGQTAQPIFVTPRVAPGPLLPVDSKQDNLRNETWNALQSLLRNRASVAARLIKAVEPYPIPKDKLQSVEAARSAVMSAAGVQAMTKANCDFDGSLSRLLVETEGQQALKSDKRFIDTQDELAGAENKIAVARRKYNEVVQQHNGQNDGPRWQELSNCPATPAPKVIF